MNYEIKKFNILYEQTEQKLICEAQSKLISWLTKTWSFREEFDQIRPLVMQKVVYGFDHMTSLKDDKNVQKMKIQDNVSTPPTYQFIKNEDGDVLI